MFKGYTCNVAVIMWFRMKKQLFAVGFRGLCGQQKPVNRYRQFLFGSYRAPKLYSSSVGHTRCSFHTTSSFFKAFDNPPSSTNKHELAELEGRMAIVFTCKVCNHRQTKTFSKLSYQKGIVIIECAGCKNRHLIADNLGWFDHISARNIEEIMKAKGELVKKYTTDGLLDVASEEATDQ